MFIADRQPSVLRCPGSSPSSQEARFVPGLLTCCLASPHLHGHTPQVIPFHCASSSLGQKWTGHPATLYPAVGAMSQHPLGGCPRVFLATHTQIRHSCFLFPLECLVAPAPYGLLCLKVGGGLGGEEPEADSAFVLKEPAIWGPPLTRVLFHPCGHPDAIQTSGQTGQLATHRAATPAG